MATYSADAKSRLIELKDLPAFEPGATSVEVVGDEYEGIFVSYFIATVDREVDGEVAIVRFEGARASYWGSPNDEALQGHPLAKNGLKYNSAMEVLGSPWIRRLEEMNRVHARHSPTMFAKDRHFILTFHDSTFECVAKGYKIVRHKEPPVSALAEMRRLFGSSIQTCRTL
jgi:hypothetical protein